MDQNPIASDPTRPHGPENHNPRSSEHPDTRRVWEAMDPPVVVSAEALLTPGPTLADRFERHRRDAVDRVANDWAAGLLGLRPAGAIMDETARMPSLATRDHARTRATRGRTS